MKPGMTKCVLIQMLKKDLKQSRILFESGKGAKICCVVMIHQNKKDKINR